MDSAPVAAHTSGDLIIEHGMMGIAIQTNAVPSPIPLQPNQPYVNTVVVLTERGVADLPVPAGIVAGQPLYAALPVGFANGATVQPVLSRATAIATRLTVAAPTAALTAGAPTAGGAVDAGLHLYAYTNVSGETESAPSPLASVAVSAGSQMVPLSGILTGPPGTTARNIYRTAAGASGALLLLATLSDNVTTAYTDTLADSALGTQQPPGAVLFVGFARDSAQAAGFSLIAPVELAPFPVS